MGGSPKKRFFDQRITKNIFFLTNGSPKTLIFRRKKCPKYCFLQYIGALREFIPGSRGSSGSRGSRGNGVRNRRSDPPFHGQEFSDDGSSQQTPSNETKQHL